MVEPTRSSAAAPILMTGFEPFAGHCLNPSWAVAQALHGMSFNDHRVVATQLPTEFGRSLKEMSAQVCRLRPTLVIALGLASGRQAISIERVAINIDDARIPDNAGAQPIDEPIANGAPAAYFSTLPIKAMREAIAAKGVPAEVSQTAGTFVCNHVFYGLMHLLATDRNLGGIRGGFIHLPLLPELGSPSLSLDQLVEGMRMGIHTALNVQIDSKQAAGAIS